MYTKQISLSQAIMTEPFTVVTFDDKSLNLCCDSVIDQTTTLLVENEGMPVLHADPLLGAKPDKP